MSGKFDKFINAFKSAFSNESEIKKSVYDKENTDLNENDGISDENKIYKNDFYPWRKLYLWGVDGKNNPSFLVLYGQHKFKKKNRDENILENNVTYTHYAIFRGSGGHFPSFEAVKIFDNYDYRNRNHNYNMYYSKDMKNNMHYYSKDNIAFKDFKVFSPSEQISLPHFKKLNQSEIVKRVYEKNVKFNDFNLTIPSEVLKLSDKLSPYFDNIYEIFNNSNIYMRKKHLKELINQNPSSELYDFLFDVGSCELISGLFLELALLKNPIAIDAAKNFLNSNIIWASENYAKGLKRCATLYIDSFDEEKSESKINFIKENLQDMDLKVLKINGKKIPEDRVLEGANYSRYARQGLFKEFYYEYSSEQRKTFKIRRSNTFKESHYSDGTTLNIINFKNTIEECEVYGLSSELGKIAYFLDAPRLTYYFKGNSNTKGLMYFRRYLRRILDSYAVKDEIKFMEAMKSLFTSYNEGDYVSDYIGNFQYNYFIKHYLYNDDFSEIWDRHLDYVVDIAMNSKVKDILKALFYILKDSKNREYLKCNLSYEKLIGLSSSTYEQISEMFLNILLEKLNNEPFNMDILIQLINSDNKKVLNIANVYFKKSSGTLSPEKLISLLFIKNFEDFMPIFKNGIENLNSNEFVEFLNLIFMNSPKFMEFEIIWSDDLKEIFNMSLNKLESLFSSQKTDLVSNIIRYLNTKNPAYTVELMESIIFSIPFNELKSIVNGIDLNFALKQKTNIIPLLRSIKNDSLPNDRDIIEILETGISKTVNTLIAQIIQHKIQLNNRFNTVLVLMESNLTPLNDLGKDIFENLPREEQIKLHLILIDSPDKKVYDFALNKLHEIYDSGAEPLPKELILHALEHTSFKVKSFVTSKINSVLNNTQNVNPELFMYYAKTLLYLPNKVSKSKNTIYEVLPKFVKKNNDKRNDVEELLLDIGSSNVILDSKRALVSLAKIRKEAV